MRAVTFDVSVPRFLVTKALGGMTHAATFGALSGVSFADVPLPELPGDDWVRLEVLSAGICGTDIATLTFRTSASLEPFGSFPAVLGHEVLALVTDVGPAVRRVETGQRVVIDPFVSCTMRGFPPDGCPSCEAGLSCTCERAGDVGDLQVSGEPVQPGSIVGYHSTFPGGWGEAMIAHESQCFAVDDALTPGAAVLIEPVSIGMHAVLNVRPLGDGPALVIGSGPIALGTIWSLRAAGYRGEILAQCKRPHEAEIARSLGATDVVSPGDQARDALLATGAKPYTPIIGAEVYAGGGFPLIFDCVGSAESLTQAFRYASPRGRLVVLGCAPEIPKLDLSFLWSREIEVRGFVGYGAEDWRGERRHTFEIVHDQLIETGAPIDAMVTHRFPLADYQEALVAAADRKQSGSIKVLLEPGV